MKKESLEKMFVRYHRMYDAAHVQKRVKSAAKLLDVEPTAIRIPAFFEWLVPLLLETMGGSMLDAGRGPTARVFCVPSWPDPTVIGRPTEGIPFTTTKINAGPGTKIAGFGGIWLTCKTPEPSGLPVYVESS